MRRGRRRGPRSSSTASCPSSSRCCSRRTSGAVRRAPSAWPTCARSPTRSAPRRSSARPSRSSSRAGRAPVALAGRRSRSRRRSPRSRAGSASSPAPSRPAPARRRPRHPRPRASSTAWTAGATCRAFVRSPEVRSSQQRREPLARPSTGRRLGPVRGRTRPARISRSDQTRFEPPSQERECPNAERETSARSSRSRASSSTPSSPASCPRSTTRSSCRSRRADGGQALELIAEVQQHLGNDRVRAVAMDSTDGLARGADVVDTGAPISVPVGEATLGRLFNVLGDVDRRRERARGRRRALADPPRRAGLRGPLADASRSSRRGSRSSTCSPRT